MANTMKALQTVTVGAGGAANITFSNIPQTFTDLIIKVSARVTNSGGPYGFTGYLNNYGTTYTSRQLVGDGTNTSSQAYSFAVFLGGNTPGASETSNTFNNTEMYISNYASSTAYKSIAVDSVTENNATTAYQVLVINSYNANTPITSIVLGPSSGTLAQYSTFTVYGVFNADVSSAPSAPTIGTATAGNLSASITFTEVANAASYTMTSSPGGFTATGTTSPLVVTGLTGGTAYTFTVKANNPLGSSAPSAASNSVTPTAPFTVDYLVVAGGGGGGTYGGGAGAGGYRTSAGTSGANSSAESSLSLSVGTNYTTTIGAGGAGGASVSFAGSQGNNSIFSTITSTGGGGGSSDGAAATTGGSGGGGSNSRLGAAGTANQGFAGGRSFGNMQGGGGGAGALGGDAVNGVSGGNGGSGIASSITGSSVTRAGGGGGPANGGALGSAGAGGGGAPSNTAAGGNGSVNTGGGGGGNLATGGSQGGTGGSGVIILRYPDTRTITIGAGLTGSESAASGGFKRATITAGTGNVSWS